MALGSILSVSKPIQGLRHLLLLALVLAAALMVWRGTSLLTPQSQGPLGATPTELRLIGALETLSGPNSVRVHVSDRPGGTRAFLVLIDTAAPIQLSEASITALIGGAIHLDTARGDILDIQRQPFARASSQAMTAAGFMEIGGYLGLCALLAAAAFVPGAQPKPAPPLSTQAPEPAFPASFHEPAPYGRDALDDVDQRIQSDPYQAAQVIRGWLQREASVA